MTLTVGRAFPVLLPCEVCGDTPTQRHHPDPQKPLEIKFLCQKCHTAADQATGRWGKGRKRARPCVICERLFIHRHSSNKTCGAACNSVLGRRNALKRFRGPTPQGSPAASRTASTESGPWGTPWFPKWPRRWGGRSSGWLD